MFLLIASREFFFYLILQTNICTSFCKQYCWLNESSIIFIYINYKQNDEGTNNFYKAKHHCIRSPPILFLTWAEPMLISFFSSAFPWLWLAGTDFGVNHFTTDLILVVSFAVLTALPMSFIRPVIKKWEQAGVKSSLFRK